MVQRGFGSFQLAKPLRFSRSIHSFDLILYLVSTISVIAKSNKRIRIYTQDQVTALCPFGFHHHDFELAVIESDLDKGAKPGPSTNKSPSYSSSPSSS